MGKYNHQVTVSGLPFGSPFTLTVPRTSSGNRGGGGGNRGGGGGNRGSGGGKRSGNAKHKKKKKQRYWRCKEKGHFGNECKYSEGVAAAKKAEFLKKKEENAATTAATASSSVKPPFAGWKQGFVMPTPLTNTNNFDMN
ncbi:cold shock protein 2-like [Folsomia candida]|nr:cold shock protein 2-like [Folsomia candida]